MSSEEEQASEVISVGALEALNRSEIDVQIATAKRYPRSVARAKAEAETMATSDIETAASCFYKIPRGGKMIEGPSVRLAEIFASAWGNIRFGARVVGEDQKFVTAQGVCHDLEKNVATTIDITRRITDSHGRKYNDDMIGVTKNAASSIAVRQAILKVIPRTYINAIYLKCKKVAVGDAKTLVARRDEQIAYFTGKMGVPLERILNVVNRSKVEDITLDDMETLLGLGTSVKDGDLKLDEAFPPLEAAKAADGTPPASKADALAKDLADKAKAKSTAEKPAQEKKAHEAPPKSEAKEETKQADNSESTAGGWSTEVAADLSSYEGFLAAMEVLALKHNVPSDHYQHAMGVVQVDHLIKQMPGNKKGDAARKLVYEAAVNGAFDWQSGKVAG